VVVRTWKCPPDVVSLNLCEAGVIELRSKLPGCGIGIEASVFTLDDADALLAAPWAKAVHRVLLEVIFEHDDDEAVRLARAIDQRGTLLGPTSASGTAMPALTGRLSKLAWRPA
jgi:hypothetical protein